MKKPHKNTSGKCDSRGCNTSCVNCPLNSVTIFEYYKSDFNYSINYKKEYPSIETSLVSHYISRAWKPPNNILV
ncbi:MAG: hypothetical protein ABI834_02275 [Ginsengibacter sp.]